MTGAAIAAGSRFILVRDETSGTAAHVGASELIEIAGETSEEDPTAGGTSEEDTTVSSS